MKKTIFSLLVVFLAVQANCSEKSEEYIDSLYTKAQFYSENGAFDLALETYFKACRAYETVSDTYGMAKTYNGIGLTYKRLGNPEKSKKYYFSALDIMDRQPDKQLMSYISNNIGIVFDDQGNIDSAEIFYTRSLIIKQELNDTSGIARSFNNLAGVMVSKERYREALNLYFNSKELKEQLGEITGVFRIHANIANVYGYMGKLDSVRYYLDKGMVYRDSVSDFELFTPYYHNYSQLFRAEGNFEKSMIYLDSIILIQNQIFNNKMATALSKYEAVYESDKKDRLLKDERIKNELLKEKQERQELRQYILVGAIIALCIFLVLIFTVAYYRLRNARQKQLLLEKERKLQEARARQIEAEKILLKKEVEIKSKELVGYSTLALQKQEMINELRQIVENMKKDYKDLPGGIIADLKSTLKSGVDMNVEWERFKVHFEQIHDSFFQKLADNFPNLTQADYRHCAYIKIGLATKEIATLLNISPSSVQKSRVRLKKKMQLAPEQDLMVFIRQEL